MEIDKCLILGRKDLIERFDVMPNMLIQLRHFVITDKSQIREANLVIFIHGNFCKLLKNRFPLEDYS